MPAIADAGTNLKLQSLIAHIVEKHHAYLRSELPFLEERIARMSTNHGAARPELFTVQQLLQDLRDDLTSHMAKEEQMLFPYVAALEAAAENGGPLPHACFPSVRFPIRIMIQEHDTAEGLLGSLRAVTSNYAVPPGFCEKGAEFFARLNALETDLKEHIRLENDELFPQAVRLEELEARRQTK